MSGLSRDRPGHTIAPAHTQFKQISVAYQILSDPKTRKQYNEFGQKNGGGGADEAQIDPEEVFGQMFGGVRFEDLIGTISIGESLTSPTPRSHAGKDMKDVFQQQHEEEADDIIMVNGKPQLTPEAQARRTERERKQNEEVGRLVVAMADSRKRRRGRSVSTSSRPTLFASSASSPRLPRARTTRRSGRRSRRSAGSRRSEF